MVITPSTPCLFNALFGCWQTGTWFPGVNGGLNAAICYVYAFVFSDFGKVESIGWWSDQHCGAMILYVLESLNGGHGPTGD